MTRLIASLGMYDHPRQYDANDAIWAALSAALRACGIDAPLALDRSRPIDQVWRDPNLLFGQACGYPLVSEPDLALRVIGIPVYDVPDCDVGQHLSYIVTRRDDSAPALINYLGRRAAINSRRSNTGFNLFRATVAGLAQGRPFFGEVVETGSHRASVSALIWGDADVAAIDAVTFAALRRYEPEVMVGLRVLARTPSSPAPPFVTSLATDRATVAALRAALADVVADPSLAQARDALFLADIRPASVHRFGVLRHLERDAVAAGYPQLQ
ncbi:MAG TPA: PhnD/SsuA/transferrin family substrate-binding protein [Sphingomonas sp.]